MDEKQKLFKTIRIILKLGCLVYVALIVFTLIVYALVLS